MRERASFSELCSHTSPRLIIRSSKYFKFDAKISRRVADNLITDPRVPRGRRSLQNIDFRERIGSKGGSVNAGTITESDSAGNDSAVDLEPIMHRNDRGSGR